MSVLPEIIPLSDPATFEQDVFRFLKDFRFNGKIPSLAHIAAVSQYFSRLPYENISKILKQAQGQGDTLFRLPDELVDDHFSWQAGGTCFSLTYLLMGIYGILGYRAAPLICDLNWGQHNHTAVMLTFAGCDYLVDPGYMIFKPLPLAGAHAQSRLSVDTGISLRFMEETDTYALYTFRSQQFVRRYQFQAQAVSLSEFANYWQASFNLPGMNDITLTRVSGYELLFIQGDFIKITSPEEIRKFREKDLAEQLIRERFGIPLEKVEHARYIIGSRQVLNEG